MADELDARLEARLREALRLEADSLPLLVREQDVAAALRRRRVRRWGTPVSVVAATAIVALLIAGGGAALLGLGGAPSPSPSPAPPPLASYEQLLDLVGSSSTALLRGELVEAGPEAAETDLGTLPMADSLAVGISCLGGSIDLVVVRGSTVVGTSQAGCSLRPYVMQIPTRAPQQGSALFDGTEHVFVRSPAGVRWRVVIADGGPGPSVRVVTPSPISLAGYEELVTLLREQEVALDILLEAERVAEGEPGGVVTTDIGAVRSHDVLAFALSCSSGWIEVRVMSGDRQVFGSRSACEESPTLIVDGAGSTDPEHRVLVTVPLETSWRIVVAR